MVGSTVQMAEAPWFVGGAFALAGQSLGRQPWDAITKPRVENSLCGTLLKGTTLDGKCMSDGNTRQIEGEPDTTHATEPTASVSFLPPPTNTGPGNAAFCDGDALQLVAPSKTSRRGKLTVAIRLNGPAPDVVEIFTSRSVPATPPTSRVKLKRDM